MNRDIPLFKIYWDENDIKFVNEAIRKGSSWAVGPEIPILEEKIADYIGVNYAVTFNSGTSALHAVLLAYGIGKGDEVIVPSFTFIATANAPLFVGARPVFADIEEQTYGLDPESVKNKITPNTKVILPIHFGGCPCSVIELKKIAEENGLILIEDAAEAFGSMIEGKKVGSFGDAAILSFCQNKIITTGEGGVVLTHSKAIWDKLKLIRSHGRLEDDYFKSTENAVYATLGYNFRMSNITAALGLSQLKKVDKVIQMRVGNATYMNGILSKFNGITTPNPIEGVRQVYQMYTIRLKQDGAKRSDMIKYLAEKGILTKVYFPPVHLSKFYRQEFDCRDGELPFTEKIASEVLTLPMYPTLTIEEMDYVARHIGEFLSCKKELNE
jgi:perosamine synthetase